MPLEDFNHVLVQTRDLEATRDFYVEVLGLEDGYRPPFPCNGHRIYLGERAVVHVSESRGYLQVRDGSAETDTGSIDHIAFEATGLKAMIARLEQRGIAAHHSKELDLDLDFDLHQVLVHDPNDVRIELNYSAQEGAGVEATG